MKRITWYVVVLVVIAACTSLPYKDDIGFLVSAQADSPEFPVYLNGHLCTDMEGHPGLCVKRVSSAEDVTFSFDPQGYPYLLTVSCSSGVTPVPPASVQSGQKYAFTLKSSDFSRFLRFTCIGEVDPGDRTMPISAKFEVHVTVYDARYTARERIYVSPQGNDRYLVLGEFAKHSWVYDKGKWKRRDQETTVKIEGDPSLVRAYSESYAMRFNYFNMGDADSGVSLGD